MIDKPLRDGPVPLTFLRDVRTEMHLSMVRLKRHAHPGSRKQGRALGQMTGVRLHYGCGPRIIPGWVNIDGWPAPGVDFVTDLRQPLPFSDGSCQLIFSEHVFEHVDRAFRPKVLREFHRVLASDGVLRLVVPDLDLFVEAYRRGDLKWFDAAGVGGTTAAEGLNNVMSLHTHRFIDDWSSLERELRDAGFSGVTRSTANGSDVPELRLDRMEASRTSCSLYVEARRNGR